jgi:hypothetical protein
VLAIRQHHPADRDLVHLPNGLADHCEGVVADLAVRPQVTNHQVTRVDLGHELVDLDRPRRLQCNFLELLVRHLNELILVEHVALDDVLVGHIIPGVGIDLEIPDAVAGLPCWLNEIFSLSEVAG